MICEYNNKLFFLSESIKFSENKKINLLFSILKRISNSLCLFFKNKDMLI